MSVSPVSVPALQPALVLAAGDSPVSAESPSTLDPAEPVAVGKRPAWPGCAMAALSEKMFVADDTPVSWELASAQFFAAAFGAVPGSSESMLASARLAAGKMENDGCISSG